MALRDEVKAFWKQEAQGINPDHLRKTAQLLYVSAFLDPELPFAAEAYTIAGKPRVSLGELEAVHYVDAFAKRYRLEIETFRRWSTSVSQEIALASLFKIQDEIERRSRLPSLLLDTERLTNGFKGAHFVSESGLKAPISEHHNLVVLAIDLDLGPDFSLNRRYFPQETVSTPEGISSIVEIRYPGDDLL